MAATDPKGLAGLDLDALAALPSVSIPRPTALPAALPGGVIPVVAARPNDPIASLAAPKALPAFLPIRPAERIAPLPLCAGSSALLAPLKPLACPPCRILSAKPAAPLIAAPIGAIFSISLSISSSPLTILKTFRLGLLGSAFQL